MSALFMEEEEEENSRNNAKSALDRLVWGASAQPDGHHHDHDLPSSPSVNSLPHDVMEQHHHDHHAASPTTGDTRRCWDNYESTTPMTTRPHFSKTHSPTAGHHRPIHRVRSRSLGAQHDDHYNTTTPQYQQQSSSTAFSSLLLPPLRTTSDGKTRYYQTGKSSPFSWTQQQQQQQPQQQQQQQQLLESVTTNGSSSPVIMESPLMISSSLDASFRSKSSILSSDERDVDNDPEKKNPVWICVLYGMINATIVLPVLMSFGSIIYRNDAFAPYMPVLVKLTVVSGIVHQLCFSTFSSLPFAVGQVQDAGLIFLSKMATDMVQYCRNQNHDDATMLATVTVGLSLATTLLGCGLVLVGYLKLGQYVQLLPTSVVGGYLAYIGWFCGMSGIGLMAGTSDLTPKIFYDNFMYIVPGVLGGIMIYVAVTQLRHMAALPISILAEIVLFYVVLWVTQTSVEEATDQGWIRSMDAPPAWYRTWDYLRLDKVDWTALPQLILTEVGMIFVVALSSSLDVAAIELELNRPLNYNHELKTVGLSNIVSGVTGGYTGSYIFSQSIFSLRAGIRSRLAGYVLALCQLFVVIAPFPILAYVPNFFFGSLLSMICVDLMFEWLIDVRTRLTTAEYMVCLATFALIQFLSVEYGILAGVGLYVLCEKIGFDMGVSKFSSHEDEDDENDSLNDLKLQVEESNGDVCNGQYGSL